jgi:iron-sulfur cluster assembly protein
MIYLTEDAAKVLKQHINVEPPPLPEYVRFGVKAGGCSGFTYTIGFDTRQRKFDLMFESWGIGVLVDKKSHLYIKETTIGWSNELQDKGFKFNNPHAKGACGCRTSFQIDIDSAVGKSPKWIK